MGWGSQRGLKNFFFNLAALGLSCDMQNSQLWHAESSSPGQGSNPGPLHWGCSLSHWPTREVLRLSLFKNRFVLDTGAFS